MAEDEKGTAEPQLALYELTPADRDILKDAGIRTKVVGLEGFNAVRELPEPADVMEVLRKMYAGGDVPPRTKPRDGEVWGPEDIERAARSVVATGVTGHVGVGLVIGLLDIIDSERGGKGT